MKPIRSTNRSCCILLLGLLFWQAVSNAASREGMQFDLKGAPSQQLLLADLDPDAPLHMMGLRNRLTGVAKSATPTSRADENGHDLMRNLLLLLAYDQDPLLHKLLRKKDYVNQMIFWASVGVFGVSLSQHLYAAHLAYNRGLADGYEATQIRAKTIVNLALIEDGIELVSAGVIAGWSAYYGRKIKKRQALVNAQVDAVLDDLEHGANDTFAKVQLLELLKNEESANEYLNIWRAAHVKPTPEPLPYAEQDLFGRRIKRLQF